MDTRLEQLIVFNRKVERQITYLENKMTRLSQKLFSSDNIGVQHRVLLELSVIDGVQTMLNQYHNKTKQTVEEKSTLLINFSSRPSSSVPDNRTKIDKAATMWTHSFSQYHRNS